MSLIQYTEAMLKKIFGILSHSLCVYVWRTRRCGVDVCGGKCMKVARSENNTKDVGGMSKVMCVY